MPASQSPSPRSSRVRNVAVVVALVAVGLAARGRDVQGTQPPVAPPAPPVAPAPDSVVQDTTAADSTAVATDSLADSSMVMAVDALPAAPTPVAAPATWPVDPATGQTLINGRPVVGRVFIMQKTDGTVKYPNVADVVAHEALAPLPPVVGTSHIPAPITNQRRMRGIMIQSTLWNLDHKRSATRLRYYPASTPANQLGQ